MWRPLSKLLELLGRARVPLWRGRIHMKVGDPAMRDARDGMDWQEYTRPAALYDAWAPVADGPWVSYHCATLFAALDRVSAAGPPPVNDVRQQERLVPNDQPLPPTWAEPGTFILVDLPGPTTVALGAWLVAFGCQPVCTFDNWPHPRGVLYPQWILAQLLRHAPVVASLRGGLNRLSPPVWLCDADRLGRGTSVRPKLFDNRYYLDDSLLPGTLPLREAGIQRIVVVRPSVGAARIADVEAWLADRAKDGFEILVTGLDVPDLAARPLEPSRPRVPHVGRRSDAGGFGQLVPEPSSSGG